MAAARWRGICFVGQQRTGDSAAQSQTGTWDSIGTATGSVTQNVFSAWVDHGTTPQNAGYAYAVLPGVNSTSLGNYLASSPLTVLSNTANLQPGGAQQCRRNHADRVLSSRLTDHCTRFDNHRRSTVLGANPRAGRQESRANHIRPHANTVTSERHRHTPCERHEHTRGKRAPDCRPSPPLSPLE